MLQPKILLLCSIIVKVRLVKKSIYHSCRKAFGCLDICIEPDFPNKANLLQHHNSLVLCKHSEVSAGSRMVKWLYFIKKGWLLLQTSLLNEAKWNCYHFVTVTQWSRKTFSLHGPSLLNLSGWQQKGEGVKRQHYWVEMRCTIMWMMREPRGQLHRSMLGLLILSSSSWSSSQRSSFTSSATWVNTQHTRMEPNPFVLFTQHIGSTFC